MGVQGKGSILIPELGHKLIWLVFVFELATCSEVNLGIWSGLLILQDPRDFLGMMSQARHDAAKGVGVPNGMNLIINGRFSADRNAPERQLSLLSLKIIFVLFNGQAGRIGTNEPLGMADEIPGRGLYRLGPPESSTGFLTFVQLPSLMKSYPTSTIDAL